MTEQDKQLLVKDLCMRLPYNPYIFIEEDAEKTLLTSVEVDKDEITIIWHDGIPYSIETIKPYLRPMSSMTEKEKKERDFYCGYKPYDENIGESYLTEYDMPDYVDFLLEHHFDYRRLIEKSLAIIAPEGMYTI